LYSKEADSSISIVLVSKIKAYAAFSKLRLASLVVFSAVLSYLFAADSINWMKMLYVILGGFLVTASSNGFNQIIEKDLDALMNRTKERPIPSGEMSVKEAISVASIMGILGVSILWFLLNPLSGLLGTLALVTYVGLYTPLKRITPLAVFVGAFPGAIPPMLGYIAETGQFGLVPGLFFAIQFLWQFPHFWAIAWKLDGDYSKAGFRLLPHPSGKSKSSALQIVLYTVALLPMSLTPYYFGITGWISAIVIGLTGIWFLWYAIKLFQKCDDKAATKLMFASFVYLPVVQIALLMDKVG
jgi:protoheme IX farnesyltransferase